MDLREVGRGPGDWITLTEDRDQWRAYVRAVMNLQFLKSQLLGLGKVILCYSSKLFKTLKHNKTSSHVVFCGGE